MKIISYNFNLGNLGVPLLQETIDTGADIVCIQRFDLDLMSRVDLRDYRMHFTTSFPKQPLFHRYGQLTLWKKQLNAKASDVVFKNYFMAGDRFQGNSMTVIELDDHAVINCLTCYPHDGIHRFWVENDQQLFEAQLQEAFDLANTKHCVLTGDFHYELNEPVWKKINTQGYKNYADRLCGFRTPKLTYLSLTMFWARDVIINNISFALNPLHRVESYIPNSHWGLQAEYTI